MKGSKQSSLRAGVAREIWTKSKRRKWSSVAFHLNKQCKKLLSALAWKQVRCYSSVQPLSVAAGSPHSSCCSGLDYPTVYLRTNISGGSVAASDKEDVIDLETISFTQLLDVEVMAR